MESGKVLATRSIGLEAARRSRSIAPRRVAAREAPRNMAQEAVRSIAPEAERNTHIGQGESGRSGDRQRNRRPAEGSGAISAGSTGSETT